VNKVEGIYFIFVTVTVSESCDYVIRDDQSRVRLARQPLVNQFPFVVLNSNASSIASSPL
jgi:hypothetical protein